MRLTYALALISGPVVGEAPCQSPEDAWTAFYGAYRDAVGSAWSDAHETAVRALRAPLLSGARSALETGETYTLSGTGIALTITV